MDHNPSSSLTRRFRDVRVFIKAVATNQVAKLAPGTYSRLTQPTGRGSAPESIAEIADYFWLCFQEYAKQLERVNSSLRDAIHDKVILEYGPGDVPAVALLMFAHGARHVTLIDRFPLVQLSPTNVAVLENLLNRLEGDEKYRAMSAFKKHGVPKSGLNETAIDYQTSANGTIGQPSTFNMVYSRAVLEHVNDLEHTVADMHEALSPGGIALHKVDLSSHGTHRETPLDFLCWPASVWRLMHSHKGYPNRWRIDRYRSLASENGFENLLTEPSELAMVDEVESIRGKLPPAFSSLSTEDLRWLSFWMILRKTVNA